MEFDSIIVGAGTAGCVLANRLSAAGLRVLLLEAGGDDRDMLIQVPLGLGKLWNERLYDWGYDSVPQPGCAGRVISLPRGKVLGGSSSINAMVYLRGHPRDYDRWAANGATGWSFAEVLPYFKRAERWAGGADSWRGGDGPVGTSFTDPDDPCVQAFIAAAKAAGHAFTADINGAVPEGIALNQSTIAAGRRASTAQTHLALARGRPSLQVLTGAHALRILIEHGRAVGVEYLHSGRPQRAHAAREVIVAAGAIHSPQLLMLSGIGDPAALARLGIATLVAAPEVGRNLQDHLLVGVVHRRRAPSAVQRLLRYDRLALAMLRAHWFGTGPATRLPHGALGLVRTRDGLDVPDIQFVLRATAREAMPYWLRPDWDDKLSIIPGLLHPASRGTVELAAADPLAPVRIDPNYLGDARDVDTLVAGVRLAREILAAAPLAVLSAGEIAPGAAVQSAADLAAYVRASATTFHHACGTCRMGSDAGAVVDPELRVRGIDALRVVDAAVMPDLVSGNINACVLMLAERAAEFVLRR